MCPSDYDCQEKLYWTDAKDSIISVEYNAIMEVPTRYVSAYETKTKVDIRTIILDKFEMDFKCIDIGSPCQIGYTGELNSAKAMKITGLVCSFCKFIQETTQIVTMSMNATSLSIPVIKMQNARTL